MRVFENRALRRIFVPKRDEGTGECRKLGDVELHNLYSCTKCYWGDKARKDAMGGACSAQWGTREKLVGKPEGKRPFVRPEERWEDNIKVDFNDLAWEGVD
jgi:hypothetical protein